MQLFQGTQIAKPTYYDRQPAAFAQAVSNQYSPSGTLTLISYTPAIGRAAYIENVYLGLERNGVAAAASDVQLSISVATANGSGLALRAMIQSNVGGAYDIREGNSLGFISHSDTVSVSIFDGSSGGTTVAQACIKGAEFQY